MSFVEMEKFKMKQSTKVRIISAAHALMFKHVISNSSIWSHYAGNCQGCQVLETKLAPRPNFLASVS